MRWKNAIRERDPGEQPRPRRVRGPWAHHAGGRSPASSGGGTCIGGPTSRGGSPPAPTPGTTAEATCSVVAADGLLRHRPGQARSGGRHSGDRRTSRGVAPARTVPASLGPPLPPRLGGRSGDLRCAPASHNERPPSGNDRIRVVAAATRGQPATPAQRCATASTIRAAAPIALVVTRRCASGSNACESAPCCDTTMSGWKAAASDGT